VLYPALGVANSSCRVSLTHKWVSAPGPGTDQAILGSLRDAEAAATALAGWGPGEWRVRPPPGVPLGAQALAQPSPAMDPVEAAAPPLPAAAPPPGLRAAAPPTLPLGASWRGLSGAALARTARAAWLLWQRGFGADAGAGAAADAPDGDWPPGARFRRVRARGGVFVELDTSAAACDAAVFGTGGRATSAGSAAESGAGRDAPPLRAGDRVLMSYSYGRELDSPEPCAYYAPRAQRRARCNSLSVPHSAHSLPIAATHLPVPRAKSTRL
jgi:hypothetical protein